MRFPIIQFLLDLGKALLDPPPPRDPDRVCQQCWLSERAVADAVYFDFPDAGACSRCGEMETARDSVAVVSYR